MKRVKIAELKDQLSKYLRAVEGGDEVVVTDRDRPIARIVPIRPEDEVVILPPKGSFAEFNRKRFPPANWPVSSTELLLEDRRRR